MTSCRRYKAREITILRKIKRREGGNYLYGVGHGKGAKNLNESSGFEPVQRSVIHEKDTAGDDTRARAISGTNGKKKKRLAGWVARWDSI